MTYKIKQRFISFLGFLFFILISASVFYSGAYLLYSYQHYSHVIIFSSWSVFAAFFPLFFLPYALMLMPVFIQGKSISTKAGKILIKTSGFFLIATVIGMIVFSIIYKKSLEERGYIQCNGNPTGWTPGMATKYALTRELCDTRDR